MNTIIASSGRDGPRFGLLDRLQPAGDGSVVAGKSISGGRRYITPEGFARLAEEHAHLWRVERPKVTQQVSDAADNVRRQVRVDLDGVEVEWLDRLGELPGLGGPGLQPPPPGLCDDRSATVN